MFWVFCISCMNLFLFCCHCSLGICMHALPGPHPSSMSTYLSGTHVHLHAQCILFRTPCAHYFFLLLTCYTHAYAYTDCCCPTRYTSMYSRHSQILLHLPCLICPQALACPEMSWVLSVGYGKSSQGNPTEVRVRRWKEVLLVIEETHKGI